MSRQNSRERSRNADYEYDSDGDDGDQESFENNKSDNRSDNKSDFMKVGGNILSKLNYKIAIFLFFIGMFLFSDIFTEGFLSKMTDGVMMGDCITTKGTVLQLIMLILCYLVLDLLCKYDFL